MTVIQQLEQVNGAKRGSFFADVGNADHDVTQRILAKLSRCDCPKAKMKITKSSSSTWVWLNRLMLMNFNSKTNFITQLRHLQIESQNVYALLRPNTYNFSKRYHLQTAIVDWWLNTIAIDHQRDYANNTWATRSLSRGFYDSLPNCLNGYLQEMSCGWNLSSKRSAGRSQAREPCIGCKWCIYKR